MSDLIETDQAASFRFPLTWAALVDSHAPLVSQTVPVVAPRTATRDPGLQWAMVVPKFAPPAAPTLLLAPVDAGETPRFDAPKYVVPRFEVKSDSASLAVKLVLSAFVILLFIPGWRNTGSPGARAVEAESTMSARDWIRPSGELALFEPSLGQADYRIEFNWRVNPRGLAWVFRAQDKDNYYAFRIKPDAGGASRMLSVSHFMVYRGVEKSRTTKATAISKDDPSLRVKMDVAGSAFKLYLDGVPVSQWNDTRLTTGGFGFLEAGPERARVQSLRMSVLAKPRP